MNIAKVQELVAIPSFQVQRKKNNLIYVYINILLSNRNSVSLYILYRI